MPEEPLGIRSRLAPPGGELGAIHWESIEIMGDRLDNLRVEWSPAALPISARRFEHLADTLSGGPDGPFNIRFVAPCGEIPCRKAYRFRFSSGNRDSFFLRLEVIRANTTRCSAGKKLLQ